MKKCSKCKLEKPLEAFAKKRNGRQAYCKECHSDYRKEHYLQNRQKYIDKAGAWKRSLKRKVDLIKSVPCADCGVRYPPPVMEFDYRLDKLQDVARMVGDGLGWSKIQAEIDKCDIVCANCHRLRHYYATIAQVAER